MTKVSVIMPVYNTDEIYLKKAIESVLAQTLSDFEFLIVNDGSTNNALDIIQEYALKDERIKVINQENQGQAIARNQALDHAVGEYIAFIDSDDYIHPQMFEALSRTAEKTKVDVVAMEKFNQLSKHKKALSTLDLEQLSLSVHHKPLEHLLFNTWSSSVIWNKLYTRKILQDKRFIEGIYFEDWPFITCLFAELKEYATIPYPLYCYNDVSTSTVRSTFTVKKIDDYAKGIEFTDAYFNQPKYQSMKRVVQKKRIIPSLKMMINKTKREKVGQPELSRHLIEVLERLKNKKVFYMRDLSLKLIIRILVLKMKSLG